MADDGYELISCHGDDYGLVTCGICKLDIDKPKLLPCLHSFCLECMRKLHQQSQKCPSCREAISWPPDGVDGLKDNNFLNKLKARRDICKPMKGSPCTCCGATNGDFPSRCSDCNGFLCRNCVDLHKNIAPLKAHAVIAIEDLRSGKVDVTKVLKQESCVSHTDQPLEFFCKTCGAAICHSCTVVDHSRPEHDCVTLDVAAENQKQRWES
ncbi:E3 ubiquitin-protein ligase TRIM56-like [Amphiura filiformis]|uniref:E3 ubiquitin-protein ligase TRIM56-like n=1 Tax=Amphiura filiformis TaxID=82378 RepID=UPI003B218D71